MKTKQIQFEGNQLKLSVKRPSHFITIFMFGAASLCIIVPLLFLMNLFLDENAAPIQSLTWLFVIVLVLFGLYLLKTFIWNFFGQEVYIFSDDKILFYSDYKYFKANKKEFDKKNLEFKTERSGFENEKKSVLVFQSKSGEHKSKVELNENEINQLIELLNQK